MTLTRRLVTLALPAAPMLAALLLAAPLHAAGPLQTPTKWDMATEYPAGAMPGEGVGFFAAEAGRLSGGKLVIAPSYNAEKGIQSAAMIEAVREGKLAAGDAFAGALLKVHPAFGLSSLPFLATSIADAKALADLARPLYQQVLDQNGQILLYVTPWPASGIWSKARVATAADIRGLSIRTYDATSTAVMKAAGATALTLSFTDVMPKLKDGSVNAVLSSGDGGAGRKLWDFLPHFTEVNYAMPLSVASVSRTAFAALPAAQQKAVTAAAAATEAHQWAAMATRLDANYKRMKENSVAIAPATSEVAAVLRKAAAESIAAWKQTAGPDAVAVLDRYLARTK